MRCRPADSRPIDGQTAVDELTFTSRPPAVDRYAKARDDDSLFQNLVQSPLRAGLLRFLNARSAERFDLASLMSTFGRMRLDVENCLRELVEFGVVRRLPGVTPTYLAQRPQRQDTAQQLHVFLERQAAVSSEDQAPSVQRFREMIGRDEKMLVVFEWIRTAAKSDISVLILGPTGSGKEVVARMIHELSRRGSENFQAVNCAALPDTLFESELFGYEKGAFTGAHDRKPGRLELAAGPARSLGHQPQSERAHGKGRREFPLHRGRLAAGRVAIKISHPCTPADGRLCRWPPRRTGRYQKLNWNFRPGPNAAPLRAHCTRPG